MIETLILPASQLRDELKAMGFELFSSERDRMYVCPQVSWIEEMGKWIKANPWIYAPEKSDCDDAALDLVVESGRAIVGSRLDGAGHSVTYCTIQITEGSTLNDIGGGSHATTIVRTPDGWMFFERESGKYEPAQPRIDDGSVTPGSALL